MTYVIAGRLKDRTFLMSDCVETDKGDQGFTVKTRKLISSPGTYYSLTGFKLLDYCMQCYDEWLSITGRTSDFINGTNSFPQLIQVIQRTLASNDNRDMGIDMCRFFFADKNGVVFYDINFTDRKFIQHPSPKIVLNIDSIISSSILRNVEPVGSITGTLESYCKDYLIALAKRVGDATDFKNRFTYIELWNDDTKNIIKWPYARYSDYIAMCVGKEYSEIDDATFVWNV